jgi:hypothetical protein
MSGPNKQIEFLARAIVNRLEDRGVVEFTDAEAGIEAVAHVLGDNIRLIDEIEQEARLRLSRMIGEREPSETELETEMRQVAAERSIVF